jgi:alpha-tubulin suppressor-like RCC1 family protein
MIAAGYAHTCALKDGAVHCWGSNRTGQLGDGTTTTRLRPVPVQGLSQGVQAVAAGSFADHTCAILAGGKLVCWGSNGAGQLGDGTTQDRAAPVEVAGLSGGVQSVAANLSHTCAIVSGGALECWGLNLFGMLGDGTKDNRHKPVPVLGLSSGVRSVAAGDLHTCAVTSAGGVESLGVRTRYRNHDLHRLPRAARRHGPPQ